MKVIDVTFEQVGKKTKIEYVQHWSRELHIQDFFSAIDSSVDMKYSNIHIK